MEGEPRPFVQWTNVARRTTEQDVQAGGNLELQRRARDGWYSPSYEDLTRPVDQGNRRTTGQAVLGLLPYTAFVHPWTADVRAGRTLEERCRAREG
jgi:hypothetical protein